MPSLVLHVDMDAFFASVEIRSDPRLAGKPVVVGGGPGVRGVVTTASYPAREYGIRSGMPLFEARRLCPWLVFVPVDPPKYIHESLRVLEILDAFSPRVEAASIDEAYLEFPGVPLDRWREIAAERGGAIRAAIRSGRGLSCSIGAAVNKLQAKMATRLAKPDGLAVLEPGTFLAVFAESPASAIPGIGPRTSEALAGLGIRTVGQLATSDPARLTVAFGKWSLLLREEARGEDARPLLAEGEEPGARSASHETTFPGDVSDPRELRATVWMLADRVARRLRAHRLLAATVAVRFKVGRTRYSRQRALSVPSEDARALAVGAWDLLDRARAGRALRLVGVAGCGLLAGSQAGLLFPEDRKRRDLLRAGDRVRDRFGENTLLPGGMFLAGGDTP